MSNVSGFGPGSVSLFQLAQENHATLADRMGYMEQLMGDSFEKHAKVGSELLCLWRALARMDETLIDASQGSVSIYQTSR